MQNCIDSISNNLGNFTVVATKNWQRLKLNFSIADAVANST